MWLRSLSARVQEGTETLPLHLILGWPEQCVFWAALVDNRASNANLEVDFTLVNHKDHEGNTPLHKAVWAVNLVQMLLLLRAGANPNNIDRKGNTALHITCINPDRSFDLGKMISILLVFGADKDALNGESRTAFMYIAEMDWPMGQTQYNLFENVRDEMMQLAQGN